MVSVFGIVELIRRSTFRLKGLTLDIGKRRHRTRPSVFSGGDRSIVQVPDETRDVSGMIHWSGA